MLQLYKGEYTGDIINSLEIDGSIITHTHYTSKNNNPEWHYHKNMHICFVFQGGKSETAKKTTYTQKHGSLFFYHSGEKHRWTTDNAPSKSANIEINDVFLNTFGLTESNIKIALENNLNTKSSILKMQYELFLNEKNSQENIKSLLLELITSTNRTNIKDNPKWVQLLTELLNDNWNQQLSLEQMSIIIGVHPVTISKYFRKYFSCTLSEYQRKLKINNSIQLIKNSEMSLSEIAYQCGFTDQSHFIRNFKSITGFLPNKFRKF